MNLETAISRELWVAVRRSYETQAWSSAILDSIHFLSDTIRSRTGLQSDGTALAGQALGGKSPKLRLNKLQTESEQSIQTGVELLLRGIYQAIRNPRSHGRVNDTQDDADALIIFVNYLIGVLGHARTSFSLDECVARVVEDNFVPNERYATLLIEEIPARQRLQVALRLYELKSDVDARKLQVFFQTLFSKLAPEELKEFFDAVSDELRESTDEAALRSVLQILRPEQWNNISEVARLRSENWLINNAKDGRYVRATNTCPEGALATWSRDFWKHFTLKSQMISTLVQKLTSASIESQDYVLQHCFPYLDSLADKPPFLLQWVLAKRLKEGDDRFAEAINTGWLWGNVEWNQDVTKSLSEFQSASPALEEDDIPF